MRKFLLVILSVLCMFCMALGVGCSLLGNNSTSETSSTEEKPQSEIVLLNGFNKIIITKELIKHNNKINLATYIAKQ